MLISAHCLPFSISSTPSPVSFPLLMLYIFLPGNSIVALGRHFSLPVRCSFGLLRYCNSTGLGVGWICSRKTRQSKRGIHLSKSPNIWKQDQQDPIIRLSYDCVLSVSLYGAECWRMTEGHVNKLSQVFTTGALERSGRFCLGPQKFQVNNFMKEGVHQTWKLS